MDDGSKYFLKVISIFEEHDIPYWIDQGTLLGLIRDGKLIPWDHDLDFGVFEHEIDTEKLRGIFIENGFKIEDIPDGNKCLHFTYYEERKVDITLYNIESEYAITYFIKPPSGLHKIFNVLDSIVNNFDYVTKKKIIVKSINVIRGIYHFVLIIFPIEKIVKSFISNRFKNNNWTELVQYKIPYNILMKKKNIKFKKTDLPVPINPESYLEYAYGLDWKIPKRDYVWYKDNSKAFQVQ